MCYPVQCPKCGKTTWGGCGMHVDAVMKRVPKDKQCTCETNAPKPSGASAFGRLFGR